MVIPKRHFFDIPKPYYALTWWLSIVFLFAIVHFRNDLIFQYLEHLPFISDNLKKLIIARKEGIISHLITPSKGIIFLCSLSILISPIVRDSLKLMQNMDSQSLRHILITSLKATFIISLLVFPSSTDGLGIAYGKMSLDPFDQYSLIINRRFLMPALAHILFLRGHIFYFIFSMLCTFALIVLTLVWIKKNDIKLNLWQIISLSTCSFIIFQFHSPGYSDVLMQIFLLLLVTFPFSNKAKVSILTLSLLTHAVFTLSIMSIIAFFNLDKKSFKNFCLIGILYVIFWMGFAYDFNVSGFYNTYITMNQNPNIMSTRDYMMMCPLEEFFGIFSAYKLLWAVIVIALVILLQNKQIKLALEISLLLLCALFLTFLGVDTSRHFGWSFYALLLSLRVIKDWDKRDQIVKPMNVIFILNLFVPPYFVGLCGHHLNEKGIYTQISKLLQSVL
jgi:hypothetical protein